MRMQELRGSLLLVQVEGEASNLKRVTEALEARTQGLKQQLAAQREDFAQKLFEAEQEADKVRRMARAGCCNAFQPRRITTCQLQHPA